jgi:cell wall-associated NlpC family hydrolase
MAKASDGISGIAVGVSALGLVLVAAAIRNQTPTDTLRKVLGKPASGQAVSTPIGSVSSQVRDVALGDAVARAAVDVAGIVGGNAARLVQAAEKYKGVRYVYGGTSGKGIDCSGLVVASLRDIGVKSVPRFTTVTFDAWAKRKGGTRVAPADFRAGDVLRRPGHMAIALTNTRMIHAPHVGTVVQEADIYSKSSWWGWRLFP